MVSEMDPNTTAKRMSSNLFKHTSALTGGSQKEASNYGNQSGFIEEIQKYMFGSIILSNNGQKSSRIENSKDQMGKEFTSPPIINSHNKHVSYNPNPKLSNELLSVDFEKEEPTKKETGSHVQKISLKKRLSLYNNSKTHRGDSGSGLNEKEKSTAGSGSKLMSLSPRSVFRRFSRNTPIEKSDLPQHKSMFNTHARNKSTRASRNNQDKEDVGLGNDNSLLMDQIGTPVQEDNDHIVYINCSPEKKNSSSQRELEYLQMSNSQRPAQIPYNSQHSNMKSARSINSASRDKFHDNSNNVYNENNESMLVDQQQKKQPNLSSIIMVKQKSSKSREQTDQQYTEEPKMKKSNSYYKDYFKQKYFQSLMKKRNDQQSPEKNRSVEPGKKAMSKSPSLSMQLRPPAFESSNQYQDVGDNEKQRSPVPYKNLNQKIFSHTGVKQSHTLDHDEEFDDLKNFQLHAQDFDESKQQIYTRDDYSNYKCDVSAHKEIMNDQISNFPKMIPSPSRMSKISRKGSQIIFTNRPGPSRQPSKQIERPLSRQKELTDNAKGLYLLQPQSSMESTTMIQRVAKTSVKDINSPDPAVAEESDDIHKDSSSFVDMKLSNSDTMMQNQQRGQLYPPEFGRPSDISSQVLDETETVPLNEQNQEIKQFFENTNKKNNTINQGRNQMVKPQLSYRDKFSKFYGVENPVRSPGKLQKSQSEGFQKTHVRRINQFQYQQDDGDENVRESIIEQSESPREHQINMIQSSTNRFSSDAQRDNMLLNEQILSQSESECFFLSGSNQDPQQQHHDGRSLQQMINMNKIKIQRENDKQLEKERFEKQIEASSDVESNKSVDQQLANIPMFSPDQEPDEPPARNKSNSEVANFGNNRKSQKYLVGNQLDDDNKQIDHPSPNQQQQKKLAGAVSQKFIGHGQTYFNNNNQQQQNGSYSMLIDQRSHNDPTVFSSNNIHLNQASQQDDGEHKLFIERQLERQSIMTIPRRRGRMTLKEGKTGGQIFESNHHNTSDNKHEEELTLGKAQSTLLEGKSINTNVNTDIVPTNIIYLQHSIVGHQYLHKNSKISKELSEMGDLSLNEQQYLKSSLRHSRSHQNVHQLKQQPTGMQKYMIDLKDKHKLQFSKNPGNVSGGVMDESNAYNSRSKILNTQDNNEMQNSFLEQADININPLMTDNDRVNSLVKTTQGDEISLFKATDISGLQSSNVTVQQNHLISMNQLKNPTRTPRQYLLTEIQSETEGVPSQVQESSVYGDKLNNYNSNQTSQKNKSATIATSRQLLLQHGKQKSQHQVEMYGHGDFDTNTQIDHKKYATGGANEDDNERSPIEIKDNKLISKATKDTIFQSTIKYRENIENDEDNNRSGLEDSFINLSTSKKLLKNKNDHMNQTTTNLEDMNKFDNSLGNRTIKKNRTETQNDRRIISNYQTQTQIDRRKSRQDSYSDDDEGYDFVNADENSRVDTMHAPNTILSPEPVIRELYPRDSIRSKNRSVNGESFLSPSMRSMHENYLQGEKNPKNNRHSIYRRQLPNSRTSELNQKISEYIQAEIEIMKQHGNIFNKLSIMHNRKIKPNSRLFEQFYMVGPSNQTILKQVDNSDMAFDTNGSMNSGMVHELRTPIFHYQYPQVAALKQVKIRSNSIVDFVFPNGVKCVPITPRNLSDALDDVLYQIPLNRSEAFVFTLDARLENTFQIPVDEIIPGHLNCLCIKLKSFMRGGPGDESQYYLVEQALCMLSCNQYFDAQFEVIDKFLEYVRIIQRIKQIRMVSNHSQSRMQIDQLKVFQNAELFQKDLEYYLQYIYQDFDLNDDESNGPVNKVLNVQLALPPPFDNEEIQIAPMRYTFPEDRLQLSAIPFKWHVPTILATIMDTRNILKLMTALLLERSIIVVSKDQAKISSVILGLIEMIQPFQWQFIQIPVLPEALLDTLDVPVPIIAGITEQSFNRLCDDYNLSETFIDSMTWVFLDSVSKDQTLGYVQWRPLTKDIKWSIYEGNVTQEEQDWFLCARDLARLESLHSEFRNQSVNQSIDSYKSMTSQAQDNEDICVEMTDKQLRIVDEFYLQFQRLFYLQVLRWVNNAPNNISQSVIQSMKPFEMHAEYKKQISIELTKVRPVDQASTQRRNGHEERVKRFSRVQGSDASFRNQAKTVRSNYANSILSLQMLEDGATEEFKIMKEIECIADPSQSQGFLTSFKETQTFIQYCENVIQTNQSRAAQLDGVEAIEND